MNQARCKNTGFPFESRQPIRICGKRAGQDLDSDVPAELRVARNSDVHAASPDSGLHLIHTEATTRQHGSADVTDQVWRDRDRGFVEEAVSRCALLEQRLDLLP